MGNRGQVHVRDNGIFMYTHCGRSEMLGNVKEVLVANKNRWKDADKMTNEISKVMECDAIGNTFTYCYQIISLDFKYKMVEIIDYPTSQDMRKERIMTFDEFLTVEE